MTFSEACQSLHPPLVEYAAHNCQNDVETVHRLVEDAFFDLETFASRGEFLAKAQTYQLYFNLARPNSHKEFQTTWQIIEQLASRLPFQLRLHPPVFLDPYLNDSGGYDVPSYPHCCPFLDSCEVRAYNHPFVTAEIL